MRTAREQTIDLVVELRLRRWARLNHVRSEARRDDWHPVILEEMARKDAELAEQQSATATRQYAPVEGGWRDLHPAHGQTACRVGTSSASGCELHYT